MNIYVVIDGEFAIKQIFQKWIPLINKQLKCVDYLSDLNKDNFVIYANRNGYPGIWSLAERAIEDANGNLSIDRLVVCVDSEDKSYSDMLLEAKQRVEKKTCRVPIMYVIQYFCVETWFLGNADIFHRKTKDIELKDYYARFDIRNNDPEHLPAYEKFPTRAKFAYSYLRAGIRNTHGNKKHYNKHSPGIVQEETYFNSVFERHTKKKHIQSFKDFLIAFS